MYKSEFSVNRRDTDVLRSMGQWQRRRVKYIRIRIGITFPFYVWPDKKTRFLSPSKVRICCETTYECGQQGVKVSNNNAKKHLESAQNHKDFATYVNTYM